MSSHKVILVLPDLHCPIQHPGTYAFLADVKKKYNPDIVVSVGDEADFHNSSKWMKELDAPSADEELEKTVAALKPIYKLFPEVFVCVSNHSFRPFKRAHEAGIPSKMIKHIRDILQAPKGWDWKQIWDIDDILFMHGELCGGDLVGIVKNYRRNVVVGHAHTRAGIVYVNNGLQQFFGANTGCLIDANSYGMRYSRNNADQPVLGCTIVDKGVPHFIPYYVPGGPSPKKTASKTGKKPAETKVPGVTKRDNGTYRARVMVDGVRHELGSYDTQIAAIYAVDKFHKSND